MTAGRPSRTAHLVALGRAMADAGLSHVPDFHDPTARVFLDAKGTRSLADIERAVRTGKRGIRIEMARALADTMALRTAAGFVITSRATRCVPPSRPSRGGARPPRR